MLQCKQITIHCRLSYCMKPHSIASSYFSFLGYLFPFLLSTIFHGYVLGHTLHQDVFENEVETIYIDNIPYHQKTNTEISIFWAPSANYLTLGLKLKHFRGTRGAVMDECSVGSDPSPDCGNQRIGPGPGLDLSEVKQRRKWRWQIQNVKVGNPKFESGKSERWKWGNLKYEIRKSKMWKKEIQIVKEGNTNCESGISELVEEIILRWFIYFYRWTRFVLSWVICRGRKRREL